MHIEYPTGNLSITGIFNNAALTYSTVRAFDYNCFTTNLFGFQVLQAGKRRYLFRLQAVQQRGVWTNLVLRRLRQGQQGFILEQLADVGSVAADDHVDAFVVEDF